MTAPTFAQPAAAVHRPATTGVAGRISTSVIDTVHQAAAHAPRSLQSAIGPSEIGIECRRRLAYKLLDWPQANINRDQWPSTIGTAVHAWMADTYDTLNRQLSRTRYLIEQRVQIPGLPRGGSCDLYDTEQGDVIDWKVTSLDRIRKYRRSGPGQQYQVQSHTYGLGWLLAGYQPRNVAVVFLPRGGRIDDLYVWSEPFNPALAAEYLTRLESIRTSLITVDPERYPERWALFATADSYCTYCPFYLPHSTDLGTGCPGHRTNPPTANQ